MKTLKPIYDKRYYHEPAADQLEEHWYETLFKPLLDILKDKLNIKGKIYNSKVFYVRFSDLLPCPYNRTIDDKKVEAIYKAIRDGATLKPLTVTEVRTDDGIKYMVTDGHHRYLAINKIGMEKVQCTLSAKLKNSKASLKTALEAGKVQWYDGFFTGPFTASVSKDIRSMGGKWNKNKKAFALALSQMPNDIKAAISSGHAKVNRTVADLYRKLDELQTLPKKEIEFTTSFEKVTKDLNEQFGKSIKADIVVAPEFTPAMREKLSKAYSENLNRFSGEFTEDEIWKIRQAVTQNVMDGFRSDRLTKVLQAQYGVTKRKAKFLARQETSLMVAAYRQTRYEEIGLKKYKWSTSHDERVRPDHKDLNSRIFSYDDPPITDKATGARNNPGQDYNCRCLAIPVLEEK